MREFRTKSIEEKERLEEKKVVPTRVENGEYIYIVEEDVPIEDILSSLKEKPTKKKTEKESVSKTSKKKSTKKKKS